MWNPCDAAAIIFFLIGLSLRLRPSSMKIGRIIFCVDIIYWYLRILNILGVNKYLGPLVTMMGKMVKNMIYFVVLLLVVLMSFGVCRQAILFPDSEPSWMLIREIFYQPYFMLYGEVFASDIDPPCGSGPSQTKCQMGRWITPTVMSTYLLVANILLINLLIAVFNNIFNEVNAISHQVWMFQRFTVVMEYEQKPVLPPPLIFLCHIALLLKYCRQKVRGVSEMYDNALKLFLDMDDLERLYDFEEECVEGYFREQESKLQMSSEERIRTTSERVDNIGQKIEDINHKVNSQTTSSQAVEFRIRKLEDLADQTLSHLAVIHRFMATHVREPLSEFADIRIKTTTDDHKSDVPEHGEKHLAVPILGRERRRPVRSLTEVRPDPFLFAEALHMRIDDKSKSPEPSVSKPLDFFEEQEEELEAEEEKERSQSFDKTSSHSNSKSRFFAHLSKQESVSRNSLVEPTSSLKGSLKGIKIEDVGIEETADEIVEPESTNLDLLRSTSFDRPDRRDSNGLRRQSSDGAEGSDRGSVSHRPNLLPRRQLSKTHSEPENAMAPEFLEGCEFPRVTVERSVTWAEPRITVIPPSGNPRAMLLAMHSEYTSITDELETVCGLLSPPRTPRLLSPPRPVEQTTSHHRVRHTSEMSNPEMALYLEKEHLRDAEECDYQLMEGLIQRRIHHEADSLDSPFYLTVANEVPEYRSQNQPSRPLRRSSAIDVRDLPTPSTHGPSAFGTETEMQPLQEAEMPAKTDSKNSLVPTSETMC